MHADHQKLQPILQFQTLQVFKEKRPACFNSVEDQRRSSTLYGKMISAQKDLNLMNVVGAGVTREGVKTPSQMKA